MDLKTYLGVRFIVILFLDSALGFKYSSDYFSGLNTKGEFLKGEALNVMSFHRDKMNEYLCKNYVASEIIESYRNRSGENVEKRVGKPLRNLRLARESLLADQGSQKYQDWLSRSSTLEDIYRQFEHLEEHSPHHETLPNEHEGEVTGYALVGHKPNFYSKPSDYGFGDGHHGGDVGAHPYYHGYDEHEDEHEEKGMKLKELFHFALTAIAFLAFATFVIEVIMCLMEVPQPPTEPDYILMPTNTGTGHAAKTESENSDSRQRRSFNLDHIPLDVLNAMSGRVLSSIEALTILHEDGGECLRRTLCQNSKYSRDLSGLQKIWLPIWSIGASWVGGRLSSKNASSKTTGTLDYLKAAVLGLGKSECHIIYPKCDERRRKKRKAK